MRKGKSLSRNRARRRNVGSRTGSKAGRRSKGHKKTRLYIITGISGAGKSQALKIFEDLGFYCVDNLPMAMLDQFADELQRSSRLKQAVLGMDIRAGRWGKKGPEMLQRLKAKGIDHKVLFLEASDECVIQRFSETRHRHPLGKKVSEAIREERRRLLPLKELSDKVINTTNMTLGELKENLSQTLELTRTKEMTLSVVSFGYKYGLPMDADIVMDVRFLPNPHYSKRLKPLTGLHRGVRNFILAAKDTKRFLDDYVGFILKLLPYYVREGKSFLTIAVGCTGGRHRSVFITRHLATKLIRSGHPVQEFHRDISRAG